MSLTCLPLTNSYTASLKMANFYNKNKEMASTNFSGRAYTASARFRFFVPIELYDNVLQTIQNFQFARMANYVPDRKWHKSSHFSGDISNEL